MFVESTLKNINDPLRPGSCSYKQMYSYWINTLAERCMRLFVWDGIEKFPQKQIERPLLFNGSCGVTKFRKVVTPFFGMYSGEPTVFYDTWGSYTINSPIYTATKTVDKNIVVIENNACRNALYPLIHKYACMLAQTEVSYIVACVNSRKKTGIPVGSTTNSIAAIKAYESDVYNGHIGAINDPAFSGVQFIMPPSGSETNLKDFIEARDNLLQDFYCDIGVKSTRAKKGNMIAEEINSNDCMLLLNISDMLSCRKAGAEAVNKMFGTNWTVDIAPEIKKIMESEENKDDNSQRPVENNQRTTDVTSGDV